MNYLFVIFILALSACNATSTTVTQKNIETASKAYLGSTNPDSVSYERIDFTCDGVEDVVISKSSPKEINDENITVIFVTKHNGRLENITTFIKYNQKGKYVNSVCGSHDQEYKVLAETIELSDVEKFIEDRDYCDTAVFIEAGGCKSRAQYVFMSKGAKGQHMSVVTDTP